MWFIGQQNCDYFPAQMLFKLQTHKLRRSLSPSPLGFGVVLLVCGASAAQHGGVCLFKPTSSV